MKKGVYSFDIKLMLSMYATGQWTYKGLAREFHKDHTTIMYHVRNAGMPTVNPPSKKRSPRTLRVAVVRYKPPKPTIAPRKPHKYDYLIYENDIIKPPKSYAVLLREAKERAKQRGEKWYDQFAPYTTIRRITCSEVPPEKKRSRFDPESLAMAEEEFGLISSDRDQSDLGELNTGLSP